MAPVDRVISLHDRQTLEIYLRRAPFLHLYALGDLDDFFWPFTQWYGLADQRGLQAVIVFYHEITPPVLLGLTEPSQEAALYSLLKSTLPYLPPVFYAHLSPGLDAVLQSKWSVVSHGDHLKMALVDPNALDVGPGNKIYPLHPAHLAEIEEFYAVSYPGNAFTARMLETGQYIGYRLRGQLVCAAGVHVYSGQYQVAALGNIATHPDFRGQGLATAITANLCHQLLKTVDLIGLNVREDNHSAIRCYNKIGFKQIASYQECLVTLKGYTRDRSLCGLRDPN